MSEDVEENDLPIRSRNRKKGGPPVPVLIFFGVLLAFLLVIGIAITTRKKDSAKSPTSVNRGSADAVARQPIPERQYDEKGEANFVSAIGGTACLVSFVALILAYIIASLLMAIWVIKDCRNRSVENGVLWMLLIFPFNWVALLIYLASRPHGILMACERCGNKRLSYVGVCPHCRQPIEAHGRVS